jgi:hypothetical protein
MSRQLLFRGQLITGAVVLFLDYGPDPIPQLRGKWPSIEGIHGALLVGWKGRQ